jgi:hypothetical protein
VAILAAALGAAGTLPAAAQAHTGPANPVASSYVARLTGVPRGLEARVVGGDLRMWLRVTSPESVIVLDYRGAPYLRFSPSGVYVNTNSSMYYLNQPIPLKPPVGLSPRARPRWELQSPGNVYQWHDGRLHALATVALAPGQRLVGRWNIPLVVGGQRTNLTGNLWHADDPSIAWFWPIAVVLLCLWAVSRLGRREFDRLMATTLGIAALAGVAVLAIGHELEGQPFVSTGQEILLGLMLAFVAALLVWIVLRGAGPIALILVAVAAIWAGLESLPLLLHGFALVVVPAFLARVATVVCLSAGLGVVILLFGFRLLDTPELAGGAGDQPESHAELGESAAWKSLA